MKSLHRACWRWGWGGDEEILYVYEWGFILYVSAPVMCVQVMFGRLSGLACAGPSPSSIAVPAGNILVSIRSYHTDVDVFFTIS